MATSKKRRWLKWCGAIAAAALLATGTYAYFSFAWIFFVGPGDGGPSLSLEIVQAAGAADGKEGFADGPGEEARMFKPIRLAATPRGSLVFADINNHAVRVLEPSGHVRTLAGGPDKKGHLDGPAETAKLRSPHGVAVRADGVIAVAEAGNNDIRLLTPIAGADPVRYTVSTLAGSPDHSGMKDGPASQALFSAPHAVAWGPRGELYVADIGNSRIRCIERETCTTIAGTGRRGDADGDLATGTLDFPMDIALAADGALWIADAGSLRIRRWSPAVGLTTPFAGQRLAMPHGITLGPRGEVIVAELNGQRVLSFDPASGAARTLCGTTEKGLGNGRLNRPAAVLADGQTVWIADLSNHRIVKVMLPVE